MSDLWDSFCPLKILHFAFYMLLYLSLILQQVSHDFNNFMKTNHPLYSRLWCRFSKFYPKKENIKFARRFLVIGNFKALEFRAWLQCHWQLGPCSVSFVSSATFLPQLYLSYQWLVAISRESSCDIFQNFRSLPVPRWIKGYPDDSASIHFLSF